MFEQIFSTGKWIYTLQTNFNALNTNPNHSYQTQPYPTDLGQTDPSLVPPLDLTLVVKFSSSKFSQSGTPFTPSHDFISLTYNIHAPPTLSTPNISRNL